MTNRFNPSDAQTYFTSKFWKDHVFVGNELAKKKAEIVFQRRSVQISSVICLTRAELTSLAGEIHQRQREFANAGPHSTYVSRAAYDVWSRGGSKPSDRQSASHKKSTFRFAVQKQIDGKYAIHHFAG
ncbi:hypothetical protein [Planctomycetes bacterium TBK1r]|uniref:Uncharacterized protein n=1 Tax=Stieleria magnilauensis TaxID=2527963 RepID=A0ABX5Y258_9BACT|nr:hypothetical protein TBK1r_68770 [Planctomycetes bacterium TBK1r]